MANFLVLDLKVIDSPQAGIGVARSLKALGHKVYGADDTPFVTSSEVFEKTFVLEEIRTLNLDSLVKKIISFRDSYNIEYIVPCYDETVILFSYIKDKLDYLGIKLIAPSIETIKLFRKDNLSNIFYKGTFRTPQTKVISSLDEAREFANEIQYPVFVKGLTKGAIRVKDNDELFNGIERQCAIWNNSEIHCLVQKSITGQYINALLAYKDKKIVSYIEMEKIALDGNGATWFGKLTLDKVLFEDIKLVLSENNVSDCILEIEAIKSEIDGKLYIYEVNYRTPAWIHASTLNGQNILGDFLSSEEETNFNKKEAFFGRETLDFLRPLEDISQYTNLQFYSKGAAYKNNNQKYPSEIML